MKLCLSEMREVLYLLLMRESNLGSILAIHYLVDLCWSNLYLLPFISQLSNNDTKSQFQALKR